MDEEILRMHVWNRGGKLMAKRSAMVVGWVVLVVAGGSRVHDVSVFASCCLGSGCCTESGRM